MIRRQNSTLNILQTNEIILRSTKKLNKVLNLEALGTHTHTHTHTQVYPCMLGDTVIDDEYFRTVV